MTPAPCQKSPEALAIPAKRDLGPQVEAGSHEAAKCLQNKHQGEEAWFAETSRGCDSLGRCERELMEEPRGAEAERQACPGKSQVLSACCPGPSVRSKEE